MNDEAKHTPGPWQVRGEIKSGAASRAPIDEWCGSVYPQRKDYNYRGEVCFLQSSNCIKGVTSAEAAANAHLIAAAPDLLAACEEVLALMDDHNVNAPNKWSAAVDQMRAAIAKAKGQP